MAKETESPKDDELLNYKKAGHVIDTPVGTLQVWISTGRYAIPHYKIGRKVRFRKSELLAWLASRRRGGESSNTERE